MVDRQPWWPRLGLGIAMVSALVADLALAGPAAATPNPPDGAEGPRIGLAADPDNLLPARITATRPVRITRTARDASGRPVVSTRQAGSRAGAERLIRTAQRDPDTVGLEVDRPVRALSDPYRGNQWDVARLSATDAWELSTGSGVTVAVVDSGVDASHPDLVGSVLAGTDLVDGGDGRTDPNGHGSHVAGTIAAVTDNGVGVSSFAPGAKVLPVRVLDADGAGWLSDVAAGIVYAADHAQVINLSLGSASQSPAVSEAIAYARGKGVVVVAAAGNSREFGSPVSYPAADDGVIAVAATTATDDYADYSNRGSYVDVAAPGSGILSTTGGGYSSWSGTSMASPHVAALAAQLLARSSALTAREVEAAIEDTALDLGTAGQDDDFGAGLIRPVAALQSVSPDEEPDPEPVRPVVTGRTSVTTVTYGANTSTVFTVTANGAPWAGRPASVCVAGVTGEFRCTARTTSSAGKVHHTRKATATYRVKLRVAATAGSYAAESAVYRFTVKAKAKLRARGRRGLTATITGVAGQAVELQRYQGRHWVTKARYRSRATLTVRGLTRGYAYRVKVAERIGLGGAVSRPVRL